METQVFYTLHEKQLAFRLRESVTADPGVEARFRGLLNTTTGAFDYRGTLKKFHNTGPLLKDDPNEPLRLGAGVGVSSANGDAPFLTASARKRVSLLEGPELLLTAKARVDFEPSSGRLARRAGLRLSRRLLNFTQRQDVELTAGLDVDWPGAGGQSGQPGQSGRRGGKPNVLPYISVRENNWGVHLRRGLWFVTYDL
ncbi:hypothetical protein Rsub_04524 [Raphidocelis subcapitata]|uniref:Uncharacterized protein n=1 Tax=Raphidocelis subcapitata TaxID=307507 RepID=A0A2V0P3J1_9CHLO|nr:hypothetical protein Rsub_04524 [Raphidocelis subcapitata]|eukprot:GBF92420.1 hypothetical protein Rsub_04524 [Raphidocelis subcapitata]